MKKKFNFEEEKKFVSELPTGLKKSFLKESNKKIFENLAIFSSLSERTMINLAEKLELFFAYPEEIIFNQDRSSNILILRQGKVGFTTKLAGSDHS